MYQVGKEIKRVNAIHCELLFFTDHRILLNTFLGEFAKLRKATISFRHSPSVRSPVIYPHETTRLPLEGFS